jgi:hypothetical protein
MQTSLTSAAPALTAPSRNSDETLKLSDRRFFLQSSESPDRDSPERPPQTGAASESADVAPEPSPSNSVASSRSHARSDAPAFRRTLSKPSVAGARRGKDALPRFAAARPAGRAQIAQRQAIQRRATEPRKTTFNIGSVSSNGTSRDGREGEGGATKHKGPSPQQSKAVPKPRPSSPHKPAGPTATTAVAPAAVAPRKGLVMSTSSEYTTDSEDDSEWASEDNSGSNSADEQPPTQAHVQTQMHYTKAVRETERERQQREEASRLQKAAEEAARQRELFAKVPKRSYSNLNRTRSGLLSQLLNPDPTIFPPNHPYRSSHSTQDVTLLSKQQQHQQQQQQQQQQPGGARLPPPNHLTSKSSAALPAATQVTPMTTMASPTNGPYRPKGRPQGAEMEESESEEEDQDNGIQLSRSLAQQKLAALAGPSKRQQSPQQQRQPAQQQRQRSPQAPARVQAPTSAAALPAVASAPIPLGHPYNLPAPAPPMTPRTTRRQMLATELSESLRRNLLWERQVSKTNLTSGARRAGLLGSRLQPMTAVNTSQQQQQQGAGGSNPAPPQDEREQRRRAAMARNRSWAEEYHYAGW